MCAFVGGSDSEFKGVMRFVFGLMDSEGNCASGVRDQLSAGEMVPEWVDLSAALLVCGLVGLKAALLGLLPAMTDALKAVKMVEKLVDCEAGMTAGQRVDEMVLRLAEMTVDMLGGYLVASLIDD